MKKALLMGLLVFIATSAAAYSISWFIQARNVKNNIAQMMADFDPKMGTLQAQSIETSGFPLQLMVHIHNPKILLNKGVVFPYLYKKISASSGNSAGVLAPPVFTDGTLEVAHSGIITVGLNALSSKLTYISNGTTTVTFSDAQGTTALMAEPEGQSQCHVEFSQDILALISQSWDFSSFFHESNLKNFRALICQTPTIIFSDNISSQLLATQGSSDLRITRTPVENRQKMGFYLLVADSEFFPAGDVLHNRMLSGFYPAGMPTDMMSFSLLGKTSMLFDMAFDTPNDFATASDKSFTVDVKNMQVKSAIYNSAGQFFLSSAPSGEQGNIALKLAFVTEFFAKQSDYAKVVLQNALSQLEVASDAESPPQLKQLIAQQGKEKLAILAHDILPNVSQMGALTQKITADFKGNKTTREGKATLSELELSSRDYGLSGKGQFSNSKDQLVPNVDANLTCRNCISMIDTMQDYLQRVENVVISLEPSFQGQIALDPELVQMVKYLLSGLGVAAADNPQNLQFVIKSDAGNLNINGKSMVEVMRLMQPAAAQ